MRVCVCACSRVRVCVRCAEGKGQDQEVKVRRACTEEKEMVGDSVAANNPKKVFVLRQWKS